MLKFRSQVSGVRFLQAAVIIFATWFVYSPALHGGWLWDDDGEIKSNVDLRTVAGLGNAWVHPDATDYLPLKTTVQWVQWHLWRDNVIGYHATNVILHLLSAFLLWHVLRKLEVRLAWLGGLLLAIHPLAVESVAWISELKNALSLPLLLLATSAWIDYDRRVDAASRCVPPATAGGTPALPYYALSLLCFFAAMLSKDSVVMFPFILLLHAWWKRGRIARAEVLASAPFFAVSLVLGLVALSFQFHRAFGGEALPVIGLCPRTAAAGMAIAFYLFKCVLPLGLLPNYPRWDVDPPALLQFLPWVVIAAVLIGLISGLRSQFSNFCKNVLFGLGFFGLFLLPVIGFVPMSYQRISWVADHLAYVPLVGIVGLAAAAISKFEVRNPKFAPVVIAALLAALAVAARHYAAIFQSETALWTYTIERNPQSWLGYSNLGFELRADGRPREAIARYEQALRIRPDDAETENYMGIALADLGRVPEAMDHYERALRLRPDYAGVYANEGNLLLDAGRAGEAIARFEEALRINPGLAAVRNEMGNALARNGRFEEAVVQYRAVLRIDPDFTKAEGNLANALSQMGRYAEAIPHYERQLQIDPANAVAHYNFGLALRALGRLDEARAQWRLAAQLNHR